MERATGGVLGERSVGKKEGSDEWERGGRESKGKGLRLKSKMGKSKDSFFFMRKSLMLMSV